MLRTVTAVLALVVATQAAAFAETRAVCRFTGRTIAPCPCPETHHGSKPVDSVGSASCCLVQQGRLPGLPDARLEAARELLLPQLPAVEVPRPEPLLLATLPPEVLVGTAAPPRLYVTLRQLLL